MISFDRKWYAFHVLILGIVALCLSFYELSVLWTFRSELVAVKGKLRDTYMNVYGVTDRRGQHSMVAALSVFFVGKEQKYSLSENIGAGYRSEKYQKIVKQLERADDIAIWIRKKETAEYEPKVFQIDADGSVLLPFETVRNENRGAALFLLLIAILSLSFACWFFLPVRFRRLFRL